MCRDKEGHNILLKRLLHLGDKMTVNMYSSNVLFLNFIKQTVMDTKGQITPNTNMVLVFNITLTSSNRSHKLKINKEPSEASPSMKWTWQISTE